MDSVQVHWRNVSTTGLGLMLCLGSCRSADRKSDDQMALAPSFVQTMRREAEAMRPHVTTPIGRSFLDATADLPAIAPRTLYRSADKTTYWTDAEFDELPEDARRDLEKIDGTEEFYYTTKYGTPVSYARPIDLLGAAGFESAAGKKILDFGYGTIGQLRMIAGMGAEAVGVDVDPLLPKLYSRAEDQGWVFGRSGRTGSVRIVHGRFPAEENAAQAVGGGYDLILSKNTLKNGYLHPSRPVDKRRLIDLGVDEETFVKTLNKILKPGGRVMIYNLCPAPSPADQPYKPWADGTCPFPRSMWESAGFRVIAFDVQDNEAARAMGQAMGWDQGESAMDLENDLFAWYTLVEKPQRP